MAVGCWMEGKKFEAALRLRRRQERKEKGRRRGNKTTLMETQNEEVAEGGINLRYTGCYPDHSSKNQLDRV